MIKKERCLTSSFWLFFDSFVLTRGKNNIPCIIIIFNLQTNFSGGGGGEVEGDISWRISLLRLMIYSTSCSLPIKFYFFRIFCSEAKQMRSQLAAMRSITSSITFIFSNDFRSYIDLRDRATQDWNLKQQMIQIWLKALFMYPSIA